MQLNPKSLPSIANLRRRSQALAMLDAIVCPDWEGRYYSYNAGWSEGEEMGSMRNGSGDDWFILFSDCGAAIKGLDHETSIARDKVFAVEVQKNVPNSNTIDNNRFLDSIKISLPGQNKKDSLRN